MTDAASHPNTSVALPVGWTEESIPEDFTNWLSMSITNPGLGVGFGIIPSETASGTAYSIGVTHTVTDPLPQRQYDLFALEATLQDAHETVEAVLDATDTELAAGTAPRTAITNSIEAHSESLAVGVEGTSVGQELEPQVSATASCSDCGVTIGRETHVVIGRYQSGDWALTDAYCATCGSPDSVHPHTPPTPAATGVVRWEHDPRLFLTRLTPTDQ